MTTGSLTDLMIVILILLVPLQLPRNDTRGTNILTQFTNQWRKNYLTGLHESHHINCTQTRLPIISIGDVVVLKDDSTKRSFWNLAVVKELIPGRDGKIRAAWVRVANNNTQPRLLKRSTQHLYLVEVKSLGANPN